MRLPSVHLQVLIGREVPAPAPRWFLSAIESTIVQHDVEQRSGFEIVLRVGRGHGQLIDYRVFQDPLLRAGNRVILVAFFGMSPQVLMDGLITQQQLDPRGGPGAGRLTLQGEDLTLLMDQEATVRLHSQQNDPGIVATILGKYKRWGIHAQVEHPFQTETPSRDQRIPTQRDTDLKWLRFLAKRHGFVFFLEPGPEPGRSIAYWGPPVREQVKQKPLRVHMGPDSNAEIYFHQDALAPIRVTGRVWDSNRSCGVSVAAEPQGVAPMRTRLLEPRGDSLAQAEARARGEVKAATRQYLRATGTLDASRYLALLRVHARVEVQGAGSKHNGLYDVMRVVHTIRPGSRYTQSFTLARPLDELGGPWL